MSHFAGGKWDDNGPAPVQGSNPFTTTKSSLTSFSPFSIVSSVVNSISTPADHPVKLFPNPVRDRLYAQLPSRLTASTLQVINSKGNLVRTLQVRAGTSVATISTADLPAGIYILLINSGKWTGSSPFLKQ